MSDRTAASASGIAGTVVDASISGTYSTTPRSESQVSTWNVRSPTPAATPDSLGGVPWILVDESRDPGGSWGRRWIALIPGVFGRFGGVARGRLGGAIAIEDPRDTP
jgi:hypothetical protein